MFRKLMLVLIFMGLLTAVQAQTLADAEKMIRYERYGTAKQMLEKITSREASNAEAWYRLGLVYLEQPEKDIQKARSVFENGALKNKNNPLMKAALAHIALLEGSAGAMEALDKLAKENATDAPLVKAVARAKIDAALRSSYNSLLGDELRAAYKKYEQQVKDGIALCEGLKTKDGELYILEGDGYMKLRGDEISKAFLSYRAAEAFPDWKAMALYKQGRIFMSQNNKEVLLVNFENAIKADPSFAPAYLSLFNYYSDRGYDYEQAKRNLELYNNTSDKDCHNDIYAAGFFLRAGKNQESLDKIAAIQEGDCKNEPSLNLLNALNYEKLGNMEKARENIDKYLSRQQKEKIRPIDYRTAAGIYAGIPGGDKTAIGYYQQALDADTSVMSRLETLIKMENISKKSGDKETLFFIAEKKYKLKNNPANRDIYDYAQAAYTTERYPLSDSLFTIYINKYPDQHYGYYGRGNVRFKQDAGAKQGLAVPDYEKFESLVVTDKEKFRAQLTKVYAYLAAYYANSGRDKAKAIAFIKKYLEFDPGNQQMLDVLGKLGGN